MLRNLKTSSWLTSLLVLVSVTCPQTAWTGEPAESAEDQPAAATPGRRALFGQLRLGGHIQFRAEGDRQVAEHSVITGAGEPHRLCRFLFSAHDARTNSGNLGASRRDSVDLATAWMEFGPAEGPGWRARAGRQELSIGDERLLGSDSEWANLPVTFDALLLEWRSESARVEVFTAAPVGIVHRSRNRHLREERLQGIHAAAQAAGTWWEPFLLRSTNSLESTERDTAGVLVKGESRWGLEHNLEIAMQRGHTQDLAVRAWAAHLELGRSLKADRLAVAVEYNFASGDSDPEDGNTGSFDDLYAAAYNKYGVLDPFAARNLQNTEVSAEWQVYRSLKLLGGVRNYWAVSTSDIIDAGDAAVRLNAGSGLHLTDQTHVAAIFTPTRKWTFAAGAGVLFHRAPALDEAAEVPAKSVYVSVIRTF